MTLRVADTTRQDLLVEASRRLGPDEAFATLDDREVADLVTTGAAEIAAATARWLQALAELIARGVWAQDGARSPATWLSWACGMGSSTAREHVRVAVRLRECPLVAERFAAGRLSYSKVRAITRVCTPEIESMLLAWADAAPASVLERIVADARRVQRATAAPADRDDLGVTRRWRDDGTYELVLRVDAATGLGVDQHVDRLVEIVDAARAPDGGDRDHEEADVGTARDPSVQGRAPRRLREAYAVADALAAAVAAGPVDTSGADRHTVVLLTAAAALVPDRRTDDAGASAGTPVRADHDAIQAATTSCGERSRHEGGASAETPAAGPPSAVLVRDGRGRVRAMSARAMRRAACTATVHTIAHGDGATADLGRSRRDPDARLRRLLHARDGTCRFPGCGATLHLHAHHVRWWSEGGPTDLDNLVLLCRHHHAVVHDRGWRLESAGRGRWSFHPPTDHPASGAGPWPPCRATTGASAAAVRAAAAVHAPDIDARSLVPPHWDGGRHDHDLTVGVLLERAA